ERIDVAPVDAACIKERHRIYLDVVHDDELVVAGQLPFQVLCQLMATGDQLVEAACAVMLHHEPELERVPGLRSEKRGDPAQVPFLAEYEIRSRLNPLHVVGIPYRQNAQG